MEKNLSLKGKKGLIVGIANTNSIAYGCAKVFHGAGADLAVTYLDAKAEPFVRPLAEHFGSSIIAPCDVREPGQLEAYSRAFAANGVILVGDGTVALTGNIEYVDAGCRIVG